MAGAGSSGTRLTYLGAGVSSPGREFDRAESGLSTPERPPFDFEFLDEAEERGARTVDTPRGARGMGPQTRIAVWTNG